MNSKKYFFGVLLGTLILLVVFAIPTIMVDPFFHYREPVIAYHIDEANQRYQNYGIVKNFEYDALITGTSMAENFKASELDSLFGTTSINVSFSGGSFKEVACLINKALEVNKDLKLIVRTVEQYKLGIDKDYMSASWYPTYLYDDFIFNDVNYFLNKDVLYGATRAAIEWNKKHTESVAFNGYWEVDSTLAEKIRNGEYERASIGNEEWVFGEAARKCVVENVQQNVTRIAEENPDVMFYLIFPPFSAVYYDELIRNKKWDYHIEMQRCAIEELLKYNNIKLFSFCNDFEITCNLDYYKDMMHYDKTINSRMLEKMNQNSFLLTKDNYNNYLDELKKYYLEYDRERLFVDINSDMNDNMKE